MRKCLELIRFQKKYIFILSMTILFCVLSYPSLFARTSRNEVSFRSVRFRVMSYNTHRVWNGFQNPIADGSRRMWEQQIQRITVQIVNIGDQVHKDANVTDQSADIARQYLANNADSLDVVPAISSGTFQGSALGLRDFIRSLRNNQGKSTYQGTFVVSFNDDGSIREAALTGTVRVAD